MVGVDISDVNNNPPGGFTLVELMVALAVLSILLVVAAPSFRDLIMDNKLLSESYAMRATLNNARSEALAQRLPVTVCRSADGDTCSTGDWSDGYIAFTDRDRDAVPDDPNTITGDMIFIAREVDADLEIEYRNVSGPTDVVRFDSRGHATGARGVFGFCDNRGAEKMKALGVSAVGVVGTAKVSSLDPNDFCS